ncbi:MAG TPA: hypothetical protein DIW64_14925 [Cellvibrio sp.]|nr:hypothetical protein [Cellvibrio sp.]
MTSAGNPMITRCPKCGTAFRVTPSQLQSAKGAVRCGSCLNVFKAQEYLVATTTAPTTPKNTSAAPGATKPATAIKSTATAASSAKNSIAKNAPSANPRPSATAKPAPTPAAPLSEPRKTAAAPSQSNILSAIKPLAVDTAKPSPAAPKPAPTPAAKPVIRTINKSSLGQSDDILISDDMEDSKSESKSYEFDGFMDIGMASKSEVSLFERKIRDKDTDEDATNTADESWAEMLIEDEEDDTPQLGVLKHKTDEQLADDELFESHAVNTELEKDTPTAPQATTKTSAPGLMFSLVGEKEEDADQKSNQQNSNDFVLSDELERIPSNQGFNSSSTPDILDPSIFETPDENAGNDKDETKRQIKTQPKIRSYDGSRTALLMNIIPAPIEFNAKRMRRWYQRKLWPTLSILGLLALIVQVGWFKFDYFSRVEPYRTGYLFLCPHLGCQVPTLVDTSRILASNLVVREHPDTQGALAVDVMLINGAPFEQPFPDLLLVFTDIDQNQVASRRFTPKDYLGGELVGRELMPQNQKIHVTLDLVDPGAEAVNYHISIPRQ